MPLISDFTKSLKDSDNKPNSAKQHRFSGYLSGVDSDGNIVLSSEEEEKDSLSVRKISLKKFVKKYVTVTITVEGDSVEPKK